MPADCWKGLLEEMQRYKNPSYHSCRGTGVWYPSADHTKAFEDICWVGSLCNRGLLNTYYIPMEDKHSKQWLGSCKKESRSWTGQLPCHHQMRKPFRQPLSAPCNYTDYLYPSPKFKIWVSFIWRIEPVGSNSFGLVKGQFWLKMIEVKLFRFRNNLVFTATQFSLLRPATWVKVLWSGNLATTGWEHTNVLININKEHFIDILPSKLDKNGTSGPQLVVRVLSSSTLSTTHYESLSPYLSTIQEDHPDLVTSPLKACCLFL